MHAEPLCERPVENGILESAVEYTFLQPAIFFQNYAAAGPTVAQTGVFAEPYSAEQSITRVDNRDVAEVAARCPPQEL